MPVANTLAYLLKVRVVKKESFIELAWQRWDQVKKKKNMIRLFWGNSGSLKCRLHETAKISLIFAVRPILPSHLSNFWKHPIDRQHIAQNRTERWENSYLKIGQRAWQNRKDSLAKLDGRDKNRKHHCSCKWGFRGKHPLEKPCLVFGLGKVLSCLVMYFDLTRPGVYLIVYLLCKPGAVFTTLQFLRNLLSNTIR